jgi:hypothetical protein
VKRYRSGIRFTARGFFSDSFPPFLFSPCSAVQSFGPLNVLLSEREPISSKLLFLHDAKIHIVLRDILTGKAFAGDFHDNLSLFCEFEGIAYKVNQDLAQSRGVADDGSRRMGIIEIEPPPYTG